MTIKKDKVGGEVRYKAGKNKSIYNYLQFMLKMIY